MRLMKNNLSSHKKVNIATLPGTRRGASELLVSSPSTLNNDLKSTIFPHTGDRYLCSIYNICTHIQISKYDIEYGNRIQKSILSKVV